ncbi:MAG: endolytic transglycosylase MltG [Flavobacteriia bacterium]|nr:endolytic transglycosylase MltG [Flavobacteriia bacterium]
MFKRYRTLKILGIIVGLGSVVTALVLLPKIKVFWAGLTVTSNSNSVVFTIKDSLSAEGLADALADLQIIENKADFLTVARYKKLSKVNIALGKYQIAPSTNFRTLLNGFTLNSAGNGNAEVEVEVTFNNCRTIYHMAGKVSRCLMLDSSKLVAHLLSGSTLQKYGFTVEQLPALFIPNTYELFYDTDERTFTDRMAKEFKSFWNEERKSQLVNIGLNSPSEAVTLASIVYAEQSRNADEWPTIAGLYLNRIRTGMKLQSDPTFKFCWGDKLNGVQRLLAVHRAIVCPYNTYIIRGLPPGPINLPSASVVDAVLKAPNVDFLFMCAKPDYSGRHNFAVTGAEHMKNAKIFQDWLGKEQKK